MVEVLFILNSEREVYEIEEKKNNTGLVKRKKKLFDFVAFVN